LLVERFRVRWNQEDQLAVDSFTREAPALFEADQWPGNVRDLERVVRRAMTLGRQRLVRQEDVRFPALRRQRPPTPASSAGVAGPPTAAMLNPYQTEVLRLASAGGGARRETLMERCGISRETARRTLASLVELVLLRRLGSGRGAWYVLRVPETLLTRS
jgi:DNA-binding NtrC family response regulator